MAKKKQPDFQKIKLKPGRALPRGRNVTNTTFKAKKIIMPSRVVKNKSELTIEECVQNACNHLSPHKARRESLKLLTKLILQQKETFSVHLNEIVTNMKGMLLEMHESCMAESIKVIETVLTLTDDAQISSHFPYLLNLLSCMMTNTDPVLKGMSLRLLEIFLKTHPKLTCSSLTVLKNLQSLMSVQSKNTKSKRKGLNSNLLVSCGEAFYSQDWRFQVLAHMNLFLKAFLENLKEDAEEEDDSEKEIHWDFNGVMYLELYAGGGLKPVDIEKFDSAKFKSEEYDLEDPSKVQEFISSMMDVLSQVLIEEITDETTKADDDLVMDETTKNLTILFHVLCHLGDWAKHLSIYDYDIMNTFSTALRNQIFKIIRKFPFAPRGTFFDANRTHSHYKQNFSCVQLNIAVCYLYTAFLLTPESVSEGFSQVTLDYIRYVLKIPYEVRYESIPVLLKMMKIYIALNKASPEGIKNEILNHLLLEFMTNLKGENERPHHKLLISFFIGLSMDVSIDYMNYADKLYLKNWFQRLLGMYHKMADTGLIDNKLLKDIRVIAIRKHPYFLESIGKMRIARIKGLLLHEDEDIKDTIMSLLYNMKHISWELLQELTNIILVGHEFPQDRAIELIQLLTHRFASSCVPAEDRVSYVSFLLNIAIDTVNMDNDEWLECIFPEYDISWKPCAKDTLYKIYPSLHWKDHSKLFEVCYSSLNRFPAFTVNEVAKSLFIEIMQEDRDYLPVHCAIAMLKIDNPDLDGRKHYCIMLDLTYSCLFFISVFSSLPIDDDWYDWNIRPMMNSLKLSRSTAFELIKHQEYDANIPKQGSVVIHILRIVKFLTSLQLIRVEESERLLSLFENLEKHCLDREIGRQPLFIKLFNMFSYAYQ